MSRRAEGYRFSARPLLLELAKRFPGKSPQRVLRMSATTWVQMRHDGLSAVQADRVAVRIGLHPAEIWGDWACGADELEDA